MVHAGPLFVEWSREKSDLPHGLCKSLSPALEHATPLVPSSYTPDLHPSTQTGMISVMKKCSTCETFKPLGDFYKDARTADGLYSNCKGCHRTAANKARTPTPYVPVVDDKRKGPQPQRRRPEHVTPADMRRLWSRVSIGDPADCWEWQGARDKSGHGRISIGKRKPGVHVLVLEEALGRPLSPGMEACHECDNPPCCNPAHLTEGNRSYNMKGAFERGRLALPGKRTDGLKGQRLTEEDVRAIRTSTESDVELAGRYRVDRRTIYQARTGQTWGWVI